MIVIGAFVVASVIVVVVVAESPSKASGD